MTKGEVKTELSEPSAAGLLAVSLAQERLLAAFEARPAERLPLAEAAGRVLANEILSRWDFPLFTSSSMDGFAVLAADVASASPEQPAVLHVVADIPAGRSVEVQIQSGQAARIMTGAVAPAGANAVVPVEDTDFNARQPGVPAPRQVKVFVPAGVGNNLRPAGQDIRAGEVVLPAGAPLRPQDAGLLAMLGEAQVQVYKRPRVAIFSSGDELAPVDEPLTPGKIHDSNSYTLIALVLKYGGEAVNLGIAPDYYQAVQNTLDQAVAAGCDLILSSAGVSVGAFDFVRTVVEQGGRLDFWRVNMRPGKPLAFGSYRGTPFIGLPGNPVSSFVGFEVFVRPALLKMGGFRDLGRPVQIVELEEPLQSDGRESFLRGVVVKREGRWRARLTGHQGSGNLRSLVQANALLLIPSGVKSLPAGAQVEAWLLDNL